MVDWAAYTARNADIDVTARRRGWARILRKIKPTSILEVGANIGANLHAIKPMTDADIWGAEPAAKARSILSKSFPVLPQAAADLGERKFDFVFTSGVLIHIAPPDLMEACAGIHRTAERYIACIEYFAPSPETRPWCGGNIWRRDYGSYWMGRFNLNLLDYGFFWKPVSGFDNATWWLFEK